MHGHNCRRHTLVLALGSLCAAVAMWEVEGAAEPLAACGAVAGYSRSARAELRAVELRSGHSGHGEASGKYSKARGLHTPPPAPTPATAGGTSTRTNNIEKIDAGDHFFSDGSTLVPPYAPVLEKVLQTILISGILDGESF